MPGVPSQLGALEARVAALEATLRTVLAAACDFADASATFAHATRPPGPVRAALEHAADTLKTRAGTIEA
jgi:hypothetical protein